MNIFTSSKVQLVTYQKGLTKLSVQLELLFMSVVNARISHYVLEFLLKYEITVTKICM